MTRGLIIFAVAVSLAHGQFAFADGLAYQLPADGTWVKYDLKVTIDRPGAPIAKGTIKMSSVGKATIDGKACRWIEFSMTLNMGEREQKTVAKVLVPESELKAGGKPYDNKIRGWIRLREGQEIKSLADGQQGPLPVFLAGPMTGEKKLKAVEITNAKLGKVKASGVEGQVQYAEGDRKFQVTVESRTNEKSPFGVLTTKMKVARERDGEYKAEVELELDLADVGTGAKSELPDNK